MVSSPWIYETHKLEWSLISWSEVEQSRRNVVAAVDR